jgi:hypothetical protein
MTTTTVSTTTTDISTETSTAPGATVTSTSTSIVTATTLEPYQERKRHAGPGPTPRNAPPKKCTPGRVNGSTCVVECGTNRPGGEYATKKVSSFEDCLQLCSRDTKCTNANYYRNDKSCSLKSSQNPARSDKDVDGAICRSKSEATMTTSTKTTTSSVNYSSIIRSIVSASASSYCACVLSTPTSTVTSTTTFSETTTSTTVSTPITTTTTSTTETVTSTELCPSETPAVCNGRCARLADDNNNCGTCNNVVSLPL